MALSTLRSNRLTLADIASMKGDVANVMRGYPAGYQPSVGADFNALQRVAVHAIGCTSLDLRESECDEVADLVLAAIHGATVR